MTSGRRQRIRNALAQPPKVPKPPVYTMSKLKAHGKAGNIPPMCAELKNSWRKALGLANQYYSDGRKCALHGSAPQSEERFGGRWEPHTKKDSVLYELVRFFYSCYMKGYNSINQSLSKNNTMGTLELVG